MRVGVAEKPEVPRGGPQLQPTPTPPAEAMLVLFPFVINVNIW